MIERPDKMLLPPDQVRGMTHREFIEALREDRRKKALRKAGQAKGKAMSASDEVVERIMSWHWDMQACDCWVCHLGRRIGLRPREEYLPHRNNNRATRPVPSEGWFSEEDKRQQEASFLRSIEAEGDERKARKGKR